jgi:hypothetical protein
MNTDLTTTSAKLIDKLVSFVINQTFGGIDGFVNLKIQLIALKPFSLYLS